MITFLACFTALLLVGNAKNRTTQLSTVLLALSSLISYIPFYGVDRYGVYIFVFFSFFASIETFNSLRLTIGHRVFFFASAAVILLFELMNSMSLFFLPKYPFALLYLLVLAYLWKTSKRKIYSRMGVLVVWAGVALKWLLASF